MKRNIEPSSGSSDEDKTSLKKPKKENSEKRKSTEAEITESIDGSKKRVTSCNGKVEAPLPEVKRLCTENANDQKNETECNVNHKKDSGEDNNNGEDIIKEIEFISREAFDNGRYKGYRNSCSGEAEVEDILQESIGSWDEETCDEDGSRREQRMINDEEYILLTEALTGLFRDIYRDARTRNMAFADGFSFQVSKTLDNVMKVSNVGKGESYLCNKTRTSSEEEYNSSYGCGEVSDTSNVAERSDEGLGKEASDYNSDSKVINEHHDEINNLSFGEDTTNLKSFRDISSEECDSNRYEKSNSSCNSEMNDEGLGKEISGNTYEEENCVQSGQINRNREEGNSNVTEKTDNFADCQNNKNPHEGFSNSGTSDEESDSSTGVKMSDEDGEDSNGDEVHDKRCSDLTNDKKIKRMKCKLENDTVSDEGDSSELDGESDMSTDEEYSWSRENESSSDEETNSFGTEESDNSSEEESGDDNTDEISDEETNSLGTEESDNSEEESDEDNTDQSSGEVSSNYGEENSDTTSGEDDSTDSEVSIGESDTSKTSTDEDCSNESEDDNDESVMIYESLGEDKNTDYGDEIDSEWEYGNALNNEKRIKTRDITDDESSGNDGPSVIHENLYALFNYRSCKEIIYSSTEEENSVDCAKENSSSETDKDLRDVENIRNKTTPESSREVNDESNCEESKSRERLFDNVLGFFSHRRLCIAMPGGKDTISVSMAQLKLMPLKDCSRKSADGRHKKRVVANRKSNIITPSIKGNFKNGKTEKRSRNVIKNMVSVKNEVSDAEEQMSDEEAEWKGIDRIGRKRRNKKGNKQIKFDSDLKEKSENDEDYNEEDEDSSERAGEDNAKGLEDEETEEKNEGEEDIGEESEEDIGEESEEDIGEESEDVGEEGEDFEEEEDDEDDDEEDDEDDEEVVEEDEYLEVKEQGDEYDEEENEEEYVVEDEEYEEGMEEEEEEEEEDVEENVYAQVKNEDDSNEQSSENDNYQWNTKTKSRTRTKKRATKEQVRGKTNLIKKEK